MGCLGLVAVVSNQRFRLKREKLDTTVPALVMIDLAPTRRWQKQERDRWRQPEHDKKGYVVVVPTTTCRQLGNDTTYDTEKKNPTSHDVADTSAVSGRRVRKTRHHVVKTNCGRHLKKRHFQLRHPGTFMRADYWTKHHSPSHRPIIVTCEIRFSHHMM